MADPSVDPDPGDDASTPLWVKTVAGLTLLGLLLFAILLLAGAGPGDHGPGRHASWLLVLGTATSTRTGVGPR